MNDYYQYSNTPDLDRMRNVAKLRDADGMMWKAAKLLDTSEYIWSWDNSNIIGIQPQQPQQL